MDVAYYYMYSSLIGHFLVILYSGQCSPLTLANNNIIMSERKKIYNLMHFCGHVENVGCRPVVWSIYSEVDMVLMIPLTATCSSPD